MCMEAEPLLIKVGHFNFTNKVTEDGVSSVRQLLLLLLLMGNEISHHVSMIIADTLEINVI